MAKATIKITEGVIFKNGVEVGRLSGRGEVYVELKADNGTVHPVARFKYMRSKASAVAWVKFILCHYEPAELVDILFFRNAEQTSPLELAEKHGYESPNKKFAREMNEKLRQIEKSL
jgi:hypothetical protein